MTNKQIIIDGIDISRCKHYDDRYGYCEACKDDIDGTSFTKCLYEDNCYYKQLKRTESELACKKQECVTLKAEYTRVHTQLASQEAYMLVDGEEVWSGPTRKLKQENEKLKAENDELKYKAEFFENYNNAHINKITKLEKTLTKIKEIAE